MTSIKKMPELKPGDNVELIAPASRCSDQLLNEIKDLLTSWKLNCIVSNDIFGEDILCANTDKSRFNGLKNALQHPETKAIICARGGYGSMRIIPELKKISPPSNPKLFLGMSDITALNLFLQQEWQWPVIHGALALDKFTPESIRAMKSILFSENDEYLFHGTPLNQHAKQSRTIQTSITGGNLCLVQTSIGTVWQMKGENKIILLEEIDERGYRVDRMLEHLTQAGLFKDVSAILFGDFLKGNEPDGSSLVKPVLQRFADQCSIPVIQMQGIGHGPVNFPVPLGTNASLQLGDQITLTCFR